MKSQYILREGQQALQRRRRQENFRWAVGSAITAAALGILSYAYSTRWWSPGASIIAGLCCIIAAGSFAALAESPVAKSGSAAEAVSKPGPAAAVQPQHARAAPGIGATAQTTSIYRRNHNGGTTFRQRPGAAQAGAGITSPAKPVILGPSRWEASPLSSSVNFDERQAEALAMRATEQEVLDSPPGVMSRNQFGYQQQPRTGAAYSRFPATRGGAAADQSFFGGGGGGFLGSKPAGGGPAPVFQPKPYHASPLKSPTQTTDPRPTGGIFQGGFVVRSPEGVAAQDDLTALDGRIDEYIDNLRRRLQLFLEERMTEFDQLVRELDSRGIPRDLLEFKVDEAVIQAPSLANQPVQCTVAFLVEQCNAMPSGDFGSTQELVKRYGLLLPLFQIRGPLAHSATLHTIQRMRALATNFQIQSGASVMPTSGPRSPLEPVSANGRPYGRRHGSGKPVIQDAEIAMHVFLYFADALMGDPAHRYFTSRYFVDETGAGAHGLPPVSSYHDPSGYHLTNAKVQIVMKSFQPVHYDVILHGDDLIMGDSNSNPFMAIVTFLQLLRTHDTPSMLYRELKNTILPDVFSSDASYGARYF